MMGYAHLAAALLIGGVLLVSASSKLRGRRAFAEFAESVADLQLVSGRWVRPVATAVALGEAAAVILLAIPALATAGFLLAGFLLVVFTVAIVLALRRGNRVPCRCFGSSARPFGAAHVVRNGLLLAVVALALASSPPTAYQPAAVALSVFTALAGTLVILFFVDFVDLFAGEPAARTRPATRRTPA